MPSLSVRDLTLAEVPCTFISSSPDASGAKLVIFMNGLGSARSEAIPPGVKQNPISPPLVDGLLRAGYNILIPDNPSHGDRRSSGESAIDSLVACFAGRQPDPLELAMRETPALVDAAVAAGLVNSAEEVAVVGHSWGGLNAVLRLVGDQRIACGIAIIPVIDPTCLRQFSALSSPLLRDFSLADLTIGGLAGRPLLLIAGGDDDIAPSSYARGFVETVRAEAAAGDRLSYVELPGVGHTYSREQLSISLSWLSDNFSERQVQK